MQFELTKTYLEQLKGAIQDTDAQAIVDQITELHAADIAEILDALNKNEAEYLYQLLEEEKAAEVVSLAKEEEHDLQAENTDEAGADISAPLCSAG